MHDRCTDTADRRLRMSMLLLKRSSRTPTAGVRRLLRRPLERVALLRNGYA